MTKPGDRNWPLVGCAALASAAVAFFAGVLVTRTATTDTSGYEKSPRAATSMPSRSDGAARRNPYSANFAADPYVIEQQRAVVEAMERNCAQFGRGCKEAEQARRYIDKQAARE